ncbi:MAG: ribbon-helix-helix protein, CopG family [Caldilineaceae bacterium]
MDESGEDYIFPATYFEAVELSHANGKDLDAQITVHINEMDKAILRAEALSAQKSVSALIREWIEERLDSATGSMNDLLIEGFLRHML